MLPSRFQCSRPINLYASSAFDSSSILASIPLGRTENLAQLRLPFDNLIGVYPHWSVPNPPFQVPPELFPFEHRFMEFDGNCIHYIDEGTGQTLLLLHGNPSWCFLYRKIVAGLKPSFRCVALDFPGYGMSDAPAGYGYTPQEHAAMLEQFVDRLNLQQFTIMMQDWGGPIGLGFAERRPELVHCLIIGNTFARPLDGERRIQIFSWIMGGPIGRMLTSAFNFVPRVFFARGFAQRPSSAVLAMYFAPWQNRERRVAAVIAPRQLIASSRYLRTVEENLPKLADRPVLIVWGMKDFAFRDTERKRFERAFPRHKTVMLANASHFLQEDAGEQIVEEIKMFLSETAQV
jgi:haloalkane dehalogenase